MSVLDWLIPWQPSPAFMVLTATAAILYGLGARRRKPGLSRQIAFWTGLVLTYLAMQSRVDFYAEHAFVVHRAQHLVLHHLGPFLIVLAYPGVQWRSGMPLSWRVALRRIGRWPPIHGLLRVLLHPFVAVLLFVGLIYFWLWPSIQFMVMIDARLYELMNWSMVLDGLLFWWLVLDSRPKPPAWMAPGVRILTAAAAAMPQILIGAYITFTTKDLYPIYDLCGRVIPGMSAATDQYLGGLIIWIPGAMMTVLAGLLAFRHWVRLSSRGRLDKR